MEDNNFKENLNHLKEIILDEERIVTYISISKELCIHVNQAKLLLSEVIKFLKQNQPDVELNINYIISGVFDTNHSQVMICSDKNLQKIKDSFKIVYFVHVYSVNKGSNSLDKVALTSINTFEDIPLCMGLIKNDICIKRTTDEIGTLKSHSQKVASSNDLQITKLDKIQKITPAIKSTCKTEDINVKSVDKIMHNENLPVYDIKQEITSPHNKIQNTTKSVDKKTNGKTSKGITGYFGKANGVSSSKISKPAKDVQVVKDNLREKEIEIKTEKAESMPKDEAVKKESPVNGKKSKNLNSLIKPNARVDKKRKRVLHVSDSESDNEDNDAFTEQMAVDNETDDEIPPTPTVNTVKITSGIINPKKRRKIVDKTYTDEDGYILTKKEEVYESCSDNDEEVLKKENKTVNKLEIKSEVSPKGKNTKVAAKKKISPPQKGKQATMTNFFKKL